MFTQLFQCWLCLALNFMLLVTDGHKEEIVEDNFLFTAQVISYITCTFDLICHY